MALRDTVSDTGSFITMQYHKFIQKVNLVQFGIWQKTRTVIVEEAILLTKTAATTFVDGHASDTNEKHEAVEYDRVLHAYKVVRNTDSETAWSPAS